MTRVLFVCGKARMRSPTAMELARRWPQLQADCAGLSHDADVPLSPEQLDWADQVIVMEPRQKKRLTSAFGPLPANTRLSSFNIPDKYGYMEPALIARLLPLMVQRFGPSP